MDTIACYGCGIEVCHSRTPEGDFACGENGKCRALEANECACCHEQIGTNLCGFEKLPDGTTLLFCLRCKVVRDGEKKLREALAHPNIGLELAP